MFFSITNSSFPLALEPPTESVVIINEDFLAKAIKKSRESPRRRIIFPFHKDNANRLHRMFNAMQPMSYVQPHRHSAPPKDESIIVIRGSVCYVTFDDYGNIDRQCRLSAGSTEFGVDTVAGIYHTFFAIENDTVVFEVKPGPYRKTSDKDFAPWAPAEGSDDAETYLKKLYELI